MNKHRDRGFWWPLRLMALMYCGLLVSLVVAMAMRIQFSDLPVVFQTHFLWKSLQLSLFTSMISAIIATAWATPMGYLLARGRFPEGWFLRVVVLLPISTPPLVFGLGLLIFFQTGVGSVIEERVWRFTYRPSGIVLAQSLIATAYAVQTLRAAFQHLSERPEQFALTLGESRWSAFWRVTIADSRAAICGAFLSAWAHCMGVFGPVLVFAGMVRGRTEVLSTTVWLELQNGQLESAIVVSLLLMSVSLLAASVAEILQGRLRKSGGAL